MSEKENNEKIEKEKIDKEKLLAHMKSLIDIGKKKDNLLTMQEIKDYCKDLNFSPEQIDKIRKYLEEHGIDVTSRIPVNPDFAQQCDSGLIELFEGDYLNNMSDAIEKLL